ncbi:MAG: methionyl-tRNA formyltransferase [Dehalococcoidia bacterium]|nr:methionyl-tRNA formyltransferase [Dehalococcoidia bacterium]
MNPSAMRTVFMGSPKFALPCLRALVEAGYDVRLAVTQPDRRAGRGGRMRAPAAKVEAQRLDIPVFQPQSFRDPEAVAELAAVEPDLIVVAAYGRILPRAVLDLPRHPVVNVHPSLLPRWRGPSPVAAAILAGDRETGVSIMELVPEMDAGPVLAARPFPVAPTDTTASLEASLADQGAELLVETLPAWLDGAVRAVPQDESLVTVCPLLEKAHGHLAAGMNAREAERAVRAYDPWPGAFVTYNGDRLGIWRAHVGDAGDELLPGDLTVLAGKPSVAFREGVLVLDEVQRSGSRRVPGEAFLNGERGRLARSAGLA